MAIKALFLDFYGTIVHEDDSIIPIICEQIQRSSSIDCTPNEIGDYWWKSFSVKFRGSHGDSFQAQRVLGLQSLQETIERFQSSGHAEELIQQQFAHWIKPGIFDDSRPFLENVRVPVYIVSNIDTKDVQEAIRHHNLKVNGIITSEDVRSYKPRPEMFLQALEKFNLEPNEVIHVGDSLTNDIQGAQSAGIKAVWINRKKKTRPDSVTPDYIVQSLLDIRHFLM